MGLEGLEPSTPALSTQCSNQLSYKPSWFGDEILRTAALGFDHQTLLFVLSSKIKQIKAEADVVYCMYTRRLSTQRCADFHRKLAL